MLNLFFFGYYEMTLNDIILLLDAVPNPETLKGNHRCAVSQGGSFIIPFQNDPLSHFSYL